NLRRYSGFGLVAARFSGGRELVLARRIASDAWMVDGTRRVRLTSDGQTYSVARSSLGDLLLARNGGDGKSNVWWQGRDGVAKRLTEGEADAAPDFSPDNQSWVYSDYARKSIMLCSLGKATCRLLRHDELIPTWPRFSPDGEKLAYLTQVGSTQLTVISAK